MSTLKRYTFWFIAATLFQFLNAIIHTISLFVPLSGDNETETQMVGLVTTYKIDMGAGFHPTFFNLFTALSSCLSFLFLFAALVNGYLLWKHAEPSMMKGIIAINLGIFGTLLLVVTYFTFLFPVVCVGFVVVNLLLAFVFLPKPGSAEESELNF
jgi:hypothetical protein